MVIKYTKLDLVPLPKFEIRGLHNDVAQGLSLLGSFAMSVGKESPALMFF